jgi:hypothetical protein
MSGTTLENTNKGKRTIMDFQQTTAGDVYGRPSAVRKDTSIPDKSVTANRSATTGKAIATRKLAVTDSSASTSRLDYRKLMIDEVREDGSCAPAPRDGDGHSDMVDDSGDENDVNQDTRQDRSVENRRRTLAKHMDYEAKGKAMLRWLQRETTQGQRYCLGDIEGDWALYSMDYLTLQRERSNHARGENFRRGEFSIPHFGDKGLGVYADLEDQFRSPASHKGERLGQFPAKLRNSYPAGWYNTVPGKRSTVTRRKTA